MPVFVFSRLPLLLLTVKPLLVGAICFNRVASEDQFLPCSFLFKAVLREGASYKRPLEGVFVNRTQVGAIAREKGPYRLLDCFGLFERSFTTVERNVLSSLEEQPRSELWNP